MCLDLCLQIPCFLCCHKKKPFLTRLIFFDRHLFVLDHEAVRKDIVLDIAVLVFLRSFRNDVAVLNKQLSPSVVLLDPPIYRRHRNSLREKWEALHINVIDLSEDVYMQSYD